MSDVEASVWLCTPAKGWDGNSTAAGLYVGGSQILVDIISSEETKAF